MAVQVRFLFRVQTLFDKYIYSKVTNSNKYFIITIVIVVLKLLSPIK